MCWVRYRFCAARCRPPTLGVAMRRHAAARSEAAECRELQQLRSVYFHWPSAAQDSLISVSAAARSVRPSVIHPRTSVPPAACSPGYVCVWEGHKHRPGPADANQRSGLISAPSPGGLSPPFSRLGESCRRSSMREVCPLMEVKSIKPAVCFPTVSFGKGRVFFFHRKRLKFYSYDMEVTLICHNLDLFSVTLSCFFFCFFPSLDTFVFLGG